MFDCLHRCEDPAAARRALSAIYSAIRKPDFALRLPSRKSNNSLTTGVGGGEVTSSSGHNPPSPTDDSPISSVTALFSRVFSLLDGLDCWRSASPQLRELISLNPSAFAGAVIARAAISLPTPGGAQVVGLQSNAGAMANGNPPPSSAAGASESAAGEGGGGGGLGPLRPTPGRANGPVGTSSFVAGAGEMPRLDAAVVLGRSEEEGQGGGGGGGGGGEGGEGGEGGIAADSWRKVAGETLAGAMPDVARGRMRGAQGCCSVSDPSSSPSSPSGAEVFSCDAAYSPLPLMVRALQDVIGDLQAARMVRDAFSWITRGEGELAEVPGSTVTDRERRLDQLGSLVWSLGDLRRSLPLHDRDAKAAAAAAAAGGGGGGGGGRGVSFVRVVVEQMEIHLVRVLDVTAAKPLPDCPFVSFKMDSGYACKHPGVRPEEEEDEEEEGGHRGCVTCKEVVKPFLDNPYECWTSYVPWNGTEGEGFSPDFFRQLGLQCSVVEGGAVKVRRRERRGVGGVRVLGAGAARFPVPWAC